DIGVERKLLEKIVVRSLRAIHYNRVVHKNISLPNILFNSEVNRVMIIDFE
ncbi:hypothetical protein B0T24DRAFT_533342, partial [Lasiosphaeria ovina]